MDEIGKDPLFDGERPHERMSDHEDEARAAAGEGALEEWGDEKVLGRLFEEERLGCVPPERPLAEEATCAIATRGVAKLTLATLSCGFVASASLGSSATAGVAEIVTLAAVALLTVAIAGGSPKECHRGHLRTHTLTQTSHVTDHVHVRVDVLDEFALDASESRHQFKVITGVIPEEPGFVRLVATAVDVLKRQRGR